MGDEPAAPAKRWTRLPWHWEELPVQGWPANWDCLYIDQRCFGFCGKAGLWLSLLHPVSSALTIGPGARAEGMERSCATWSVAASWISCQTANERPSRAGCVFIPALRSSAAPRFDLLPGRAASGSTGYSSCRSLASAAELQRDAQEIPGPLGYCASASGSDQCSRAEASQARHRPAIAQGRSRSYLPSQDRRQVSQPRAASCTLPGSDGTRASRLFRQQDRTRAGPGSQHRPALAASRTLSREAGCPSLTPGGYLLYLSPAAMG